MKIKLILSLMLLCSIIACTGKKEKNQHNENKNIVNELSSTINNEFIKISKIIEEVASFTEILYKNQDDYQCKDRNIYLINEQGVLYKQFDDGKSAVFVSGVIPVNEQIIDIVCFTEPLDSLFIKLVNENPHIVQAYYNDANSYNRIYPFFNVLNQYEPGLNIPDFNFYYLADEKHNPDKKAVWVNEPYVDPAGRGWMISAIAPVYFNGKLVGVPGLDITVKTITDSFITENYTDVFITDHDGVIVAANEQIINLLDFPKLTDHKYFETIKADTYRKEQFNIRSHKNKELCQAFEKIFHENDENIDLSIEISDQKYKIFYSKIE